MPAHQFNLFDELTKPGLKALQNLYLYTEMISGIPARTDPKYREDRHLSLDSDDEEFLQNNEGLIFRELDTRIERTLDSITDAITVHYPDIGQETIDQYLKYVTDRAKNMATEMVTEKPIGYDGGSGIKRKMGGNDEHVAVLGELPEPWIYIHPDAAKGITPPGTSPPPDTTPQRGR